MRGFEVVLVVVVVVVVVAAVCDSPELRSS